MKVIFFIFTIFSHLYSNFFLLLYLIGDFEWTYKLEEGICKESLAFHTAKQFDIDNTILERANDLLKIYDQTFTNNNSSQLFDNSSSYHQLKIGENNDEIQESNDSLNMKKNIIKNKKEEMKLNEINLLLNEISSSCNISLDSSIVIPNNYNPPPLLQGRSVVYVLFITNNESQVSLFYLLLFLFFSNFSLFFFFIFHISFFYYINNNLFSTLVKHLLCW